MNDIPHICPIEDIMFKLFKERCNIDASFAELLEFPQKACFTHGFLVTSEKSSNKIQTIFTGCSIDIVASFPKKCT